MNNIVKYINKHLNDDSFFGKHLALSVFIAGSKQDKRRSKKRVVGRYFRFIAKNVESIGEEEIYDIAFRKKYL